MASSVAVGSGLDTHDVEVLIEGLTELLAAGRAHDLSVRDSAIQVARALETQDAESKVSGLANRITELLHCSPIQLLGKALDIGSEHERLFLDARIVSDLRPIFGDDVDALPEGVLVRHTLKIELIHEDSFGSFFVVLDEADLQMLEEIIQRAKRKSTSLRLVLEQAGLTYLRSED